MYTSGIVLELCHPILQVYTTGQQRPIILRSIVDTDQFIVNSFQQEEADQQDPTALTNTSPANPNDRFLRGLPDDHDNASEADYATYCLENYKENEEKWTGDRLKEYYKEDFEKFKQELFRNLPTNIRRKIRDHLLKHLVQVPQGQGIKISDALYQAKISRTNQ